MADEKAWIDSRVQYIRGLKSANDAQQLLVLLHEEPYRSREDEKKYRAIVKAERAAERMQKAKAEVSRLMDAEKKAARKARDHELYNSAGLLIMAGLVDTKSGKPLSDPAELLGALMGLAQVPADDPRREDWRRAGAKRMAERAFSS